VDDCSSDGTAEQARRVPGVSLTIVEGQALPPGWAGKLWALEQGVRIVRTRYTLFLDADIHLQPGAAAALLGLAERRQRPFVSVMAELPMRSSWEKLLIPTFIYFFKMLYPFNLANGPSRRFASAAGGCILLQTDLLAQIGGLASIRGALIDDCTLAARVKSQGFRTWTGQSRRVVSRRGYGGLSEIWNMVARSAFTQLRYSLPLLLITTLGLAALFGGPLLGMLSSIAWVRLAGLSAFLAMALTYLPTLRFYHLNLLWALGLPLSAALYLGMTWTSALRYWGGVRSRWKDRTYS
jgi:hopene-associated glycosyltransferase HpnB